MRVKHGFLSLSRANQFKEQLKMHTEQLKHTDMQICLHVCSVRSMKEALKEESADTRRMFEDKQIAAVPAKPVCEQEQELSGGGSDPWVIKDAHLMWDTQPGGMPKHILGQVPPPPSALYRWCGRASGFVWPGGRLPHQLVDL